MGWIFELFFAQVITKRHVLRRYIGGKDWRCIYKVENTDLDSGRLTKKKLESGVYMKEFKFFASSFYTHSYPRNISVVKFHPCFNWCEESTNGGYLTKRSFVNQSGNSLLPPFRNEKNI